MTISLSFELVSHIIDTTATENDALKLFKSMGIHLYDARRIIGLYREHQAAEHVKQWTLRSFNDGNLEWEHWIIWDKKNNQVIEKHTMMETKLHDITGDPEKNNPIVKRMADLYVDGITSSHKQLAEFLKSL
jgi:hypothetical protein